MGMKPSGTSMHKLAAQFVTHKRAGAPVSRPQTGRTRLHRTKKAAPLALGVERLVSAHKSSREPFTHSRVRQRLQSVAPASVICSGPLVTMPISPTLYASRDISSIVLKRTWHMVFPVRMLHGDESSGLSGATTIVTLSSARHTGQPSALGQLRCCANRAQRARRRLSALCRPPAPIQGQPSAPSQPWCQADRAQRARRRLSALRHRERHCRPLRARPHKPSRSGSYFGKRL